MRSDPSRVNPAGLRDWLRGADAPGRALGKAVLHPNRGDCDVLGGAKQGLPDDRRGGAPPMTFRIAGVMASVIIAVLIVAVVTIAVGLLDLEHHPLGVALIVMACSAGAMVVGARLLARARRRQGQAGR
jgi:hypothetical protein